MRLKKWKIIPVPYQDKRRIIHRWILIGLFIRLVLMPLGFHPDLLEPYWAGHKFTDEHIFDLGQYVSDTYNIQGGNYLAIHGYLHGLFLWIMKPLMPPSEKVWFHDSHLMGSFTDSKIHTEAISSFVSQPYIFRVLFLFKLPYLFFDFACAFLLLKIIQDKKRGLFAFKFWMINFVSLFVVYIWGKYEVIPIFLILLSIYFAGKQKFNLSLLILGLSVLFKYYSLLLVLPFVFVLGKTNRERIKLASLGLLPLVLLMVFIEAVSPARFGSQLSQFLQAGLQGQFSFLLNKVTITSHFKDLTIYLFPLFYAIVLWHSYFMKKHAVNNIERYSLVILLLFYATCHFHPQYFIWMIPFLCLQFSQKKELLLPHLIQILCFLIFALDGGLLLVKLFSPLKPSLIQASLHPPSVIRELAHPLREVIIDISRTVFLATSLWMTYLVFRKIRERNDVSSY